MGDVDYARLAGASAFLSLDKWVRADRVAVAHGLPAGASLIGASEKHGFGTVVMQPTSLCNMNCSYCYLPDRRIAAYVSEEVVARVAEAVMRQTSPSYVLWHGGEPMAAGIKRFSRYLDCFSAAVEAGLCRHSLQTNATLITRAWCELLLKHRFRVGVSIDGGPSLNNARRFWNGRSAYAAATRGMALLREAGINFGLIAVVNEHNVDEPSEFYETLVRFDPASISINVEEIEGLNIDNLHVAEERVRRFWLGLYEAWSRNPKIPIRQFRDTLGAIQSVRRGVTPSFNKENNLYPTIDVNGDVVLLSPEFAAAARDERGRFIVGNVLDAELEEIVRTGRSREYVESFFSGIERCKAECEHFMFCGGGQASNKYFETGKLDVTVTRYCKGARIFPAEAVLSAFESRSEHDG